MGGVTATTAVECAAGVSSATGTIASVESISPASIVGATTAADGLPHVGLGFVVGHVGRLVLDVPDWSAVGFVACLQGAGCHCIAKHLDLPLHGID